jgi:YVTN family beta-propeller protein
MAGDPAGPRGDDTVQRQRHHGDVRHRQDPEDRRLARDYDGVHRQRQHYVIDINAGVTTCARRRHGLPRAFHNSVVLPNGQVVIVGGQTRAVGFSDTTRVLPAELFDPKTETFTTLPAMAARRATTTASRCCCPTARDVGRRRPVRRGLRGQPADLRDPHAAYLFKGDGSPAVRPVITSAPATVRYGRPRHGHADSAITSFAIVRLSSTTHTVNNDQRRLSLIFRTPSAPTATRSRSPPIRAGLLPGNWMLFAMNAPHERHAGTRRQLPGERQRHLQRRDGLDRLRLAGHQRRCAGQRPEGRVLPGRIFSGTPLRVASEAIDFDWGTNSPGAGVPVDNFAVRWTGWLQAASTGNHVLQTLSDDGVRVWVNNVLVIDNWTDHGPTLNNSAALALTAGVRVPIRVEYYEATGGATISLRWSTPTNASFTAIPSAQLSSTSLLPNQSPAIATPSLPNTFQGLPLSLPVPASDPDGDPLGYSASGLPSGMAINSITGIVSGTPVLAGTYDVTLGVIDGRGGAAVTRFDWVVLAPNPVLLPVQTAPATSGSAVSYSALTQTPSVYSYQWDFGDGTPVTAWSENASISHVFTAPGIYQVSVTARTADGRSAVTSFWQAIQGTQLALGGRSSSALALEPRVGLPARLWVVNPDNDSVSVIDTATRARLAEIPVGSRPRTLALAPDGRIWVANHGSASLSIISPSTLAVVQTVALPRASQPYGVIVGSGGNAWVSLEAGASVLRLSSTGTVLASASVGPNVRHLGRGIPNYLGAPAIAPDGQQRLGPVQAGQHPARPAARRPERSTSRTACAPSARGSTWPRWPRTWPARVDHDNAAWPAPPPSTRAAPTCSWRWRPTARSPCSTRWAGASCSASRPVVAPQGVAVSPTGGGCSSTTSWTARSACYDLSRCGPGRSRSAAAGDRPGTVASDACRATVLRGKQLFYDARDPGWRATAT